MAGGCRPLEVRLEPLPGAEAAGGLAGAARAARRIFKAAPVGSPTVVDLSSRPVARQGRLKAVTGSVAYTAPPITLEAAAARRAPVPQLETLVVRAAAGLAGTMAPQPPASGRISAAEEAGLAAVASPALWEPRRCCSWSS